MLSEQALQLVDIVARLGSFTAAAAHLNKVPSAVSYAIKQIEDEIDVILFERHHRSVSLTPAGTYFIEESRVIMKQLRKLKEQTKNLEQGWQPKLSISIDNVVRADKISLMITDFYRKFKDVELNVKIDVFNGVWESLVTQEADLAIAATTSVPIGSEFATKSMGTIDWAFVVSHKHPLASKTELLTNDDIRDYPAICLADTARKIPKRNSWILEGQSRILVPDWIRAINCFREGLGVGFIPKNIAWPFLNNGNLIKKDLESQPTPTPCCLAWNKHNKSPALVWMLSYLGNSNKLQTDWLN